MDLKSVHDIFTNRILRIPSYQRGYSWTNNKPVETDSQQPLKNIKGQLKDLWDDIMNIPENSWHYTGLLTLVKIPVPEYNWLPRHTQYAIVDGQQRITSILILLSVIIEKAKVANYTLGDREGDAEFQYLIVDKGVKGYVFGYERDNPSDKYFRKYILKLDEIEDDSEESVYTENLLKAKVFFSTMLELYLKRLNIPNNKALQQLYDKVTTRLKLNEYILPEELDEYVVFETMNNRGKPLSQLEKLKNRLMYLNDKFEFDNINLDDSNDLRDSEKLKIAQHNALEEAINKSWITVYKSLGRNKRAPLNDEDFIKNHWITYFGNYSRSEANVYANFLFDEHFNLQNVYEGKLTVKETKKYVKSLQKCSVWWAKLHNPSFFEASDTNLKNAILGIHRVGFKTSFKPLLLAILTRDDREDFTDVIYMLEKYSFKIFDISDRQSNTGDSKIFSLANSVYNLKINALKTYEDIKQYISEYYSFDLFVNQSTELFKTGHKQGFYKWPGIHYLLFQYDHNLREKNSTTTKASELLWKDFYSKNSIEHIYPQSAIPSLKKYAEYRKKPQEDVKANYDKIQLDWSAFSHYNSDERKRMANSLGNLLAISSSDNSSFNNDPFLFKVDQSNKGEQYKNRGYKFDSMSAMLVASQNDSWSPASIIKRGLEILEYLCEFIGEDFKLLSEENKYKILGLEFMLKSNKYVDLKLKNVR